MARTYIYVIGVGLKVVLDNIFIKNKGKALISEVFKFFIDENEIIEIYIIGADATKCIKSYLKNLELGQSFLLLSKFCNFIRIKKEDVASRHPQIFYLLCVQTPLPST